ncbi:type II toxin-antitoxin system RelE/ParE family toxin [Proteiniclasticum sp. C24MP]|uniref:type II toxin-antitoxin system RelE/ParE family toxin n=1 Tax=Proteiniclasticum sp. C24MP TaxID=3374101 RepID=UPI003753F6DD
MYRLDVSEPAEKDLLDIVKYIAFRLSLLMSAAQMMEIFEEAILSLAESTERYPL